MNRRLALTSGVLFFLVLSGFVAVAIMLFFPRGAGAGSPTPGGFIRRLAANFETFGAPAEVATTLPPLPGGAGGTAIYSKTVFVPADVNTLYVTISAVGDVHGGARLELACAVDDDPCNPGANPVGDAPSGWLTAMRHKNYNENYALRGAPFFGDGGGGAGDLHDNSVYYTWCKAIARGGLRTVTVRLASQTPVGEAGGPVFLEAIHFFIDASKPQPGDQCTPIPGPGATPAGGGQTLTNGH